MNIVMMALAAGALILLIWMQRGRGSSCCQGGEPPVEALRPRDTDPGNYPVHYLLKVEGMVCGNCVKRVENAFHAKQEFLARGDLGKKEVRLSAKRSWSRREIAGILEEAGYTLMDFEEEAGKKDVKNAP